LRAWLGLAVAFRAVCLPSSYPVPPSPSPPPSIFRIIELSMFWPAKSVEQRTYRSKSREHRTYGPISDRERPCRYCRMHCLCWDNDGMKLGLCARSDVTRGLWKSLGDASGEDRWRNAKLFALGMLILCKRRKGWDSCRLHRSLFTVHCSLFIRSSLTANVAEIETSLA
jgi:hypothetical protein